MTGSRASLIASVNSGFRGSFVPTFFYLAPTLPLTVPLIASLGGRVVLTSWGEFQVYHVVCRGKNEEGVKQETLKIGSS